MMQESMRPLMIPQLLPGEYRNPFHFLNEFDQWFEFQRRKRFAKQSTFEIISDMLRNDIKRAAKSLDTNYSGIRFDCRMQFGASVINSRSIISTITA